VGVAAFVVGAGAACPGRVDAWTGACGVANGGGATGVAEAIADGVGGIAPGAGVNAGPGNPGTGAEVAIDGIGGGAGVATGG